jgi:hypothetical protein
MVRIPKSQLLVFGVLVFLIILILRITWFFNNVPALGVIENKL